MHGGGTSDITISNNTFSNFHPLGGDHPDAIQFWTTGATASAHDIVITGNTMTRGSGDVFQGIFMGADPSLPFLHVTIEDNAVVGSMYHGISVQNAQDVTIDHNLVQGYSDMKSWIFISKTIDSTIENNESTSLNIPNDNVNLSNIANTVLPLQTIGDLTVLQQWLQPAATPALPASPGPTAPDPFADWSGFGWMWF
jgi:hypothetical protein